MEKETYGNHWNSMIFCKGSSLTVVQKDPKGTKRSTNRGPLPSSFLAVPANLGTGCTGARPAIVSKEVGCIERGRRCIRVWWTSTCLDGGLKVYHIRCWSPRSPSPPGKMISNAFFFFDGLPVVPSGLVCQSPTAALRSRVEVCHAAQSRPDLAQSRVLSGNMRQ